MASAHHVDSSVMSEQPSAADLRAQLARIRPRIPFYILAARLRMHPVRLSALLNERRPLPADMAAKIQQAIREAR